MIGVIKVFLGIMLGLIALAAMTGTAGYFFFTTNLSARPERPKFAEEGKPKPKPPVVKKPILATEKAATKPVKEQPEIPAGAYQATVTWNTGVLLRQEAADNSSKTGSVAFKEKLTVIEENNEKTWVKVRNSDGTLEGWIKSGNVERDPSSN